MRTASQRYAFIHSLGKRYSLWLACETLEVSVSGYYAWLARKDRPCARTLRDQQLQVRILRLHQLNRRVYGSPRMTQALRREGERVARKRVARLMKQQRLRGRCAPRRLPRTTDSRHGGPIAPNRLLNQAAPTAPNRVWVADITYVPVADGWLYLAAILDLFSRKVVGWAFSKSLQSDLCLRALAMALRHRKPHPGLIHHSDRGVQYASAAYRNALHHAGLLQSMSRKANCYDNAQMESFWSTLKLEAPSTVGMPADQARLSIFDYIETFYNVTRLHSALRYLSPLEYEKCSPRTAIKKTDASSDKITLAPPAN